MTRIKRLEAELEFDLTRHETLRPDNPGGAGRYLESAAKTASILTALYLQEMRREVVIVPTLTFEADGSTTRPPAKKCGCYGIDPEPCPIHGECPRSPFKDPAKSKHIFSGFGCPAGSQACTRCDKME